MKVRIVSFETAGIVLRRRRATPFTVAYREILTAERLRSPRRGLRLHTRMATPLVVRYDSRQEATEEALRQRGVRVVDCWGCIIAPTLTDFETELHRAPTRVRQSYDDARGEPS